MRSFITIFNLIFLALSLSFCSSSPKTEEPELTDENYQSSGVFGDIENEARSTSSEPYSDDDYGQLDDEDASDEDLFTSNEEVEPVKPEPTAKPKPQAIQKVVKQKVQKSNKPKKSQAISSSQSSAFRNGMYGVSKDCNMHAKASLQSKKEGTVNRGKKLWMENHDKNWVKVFKKSGPVFINKNCLQ